MGEPPYTMVSREEKSVVLHPGSASRTDIIDGTMQVFVTRYWGMARRMALGSKLFRTTLRLPSASPRTSHQSPPMWNVGTNNKLTVLSLHPIQGSSTAAISIAMAKKLRFRNCTPLG